MMVKCVACKQYLPFSTLALHQVDDCPSKHKLQGKNKRNAPFEDGRTDKHIVHCDDVRNDDSSPDILDMSEDEFSCEDDPVDEMDEEEENRTPKKDMNVFKVKMDKGLLDCSYCQLPLLPRPVGVGAFMCISGHIFCGFCIDNHGKACDAVGPARIFYCSLLGDIVAQIKVKCGWEKYIPYCKFLELQRVPSLGKSYPSPLKMECMLNKSCLLCSECEVPLRPPIFRHCSRKLLVCSGCYQGNITTYHHCADLEYLVQGMTVKCMACEEYLPFSRLALHQLDDCPFKHKLQKITAGPSARKEFSDEEENERSTLGNNIIQCKNKLQALFEVGQMDEHIVHSDEEMNLCKLKIKQGLVDCLCCLLPDAPQEMHLYKLKMKLGLLDCSYCHLPLFQPLFMCMDVHIFCGRCIDGHGKSCPASIFYCRSLDNIIAQIEVKCHCEKYISHCKFLEHHNECLFAKSSPPAWRECMLNTSSSPAWREFMLKTSRLLCSECEAPLRPPIFRHCTHELLVCRGCYDGDFITYRHCADVEYLIQGVTVECVACKEYLPFSTLALHQLDDYLFKHKLQKFVPGSSARKKSCDEEGTGRYTAGNNIIHGKNKRKAPFEVGKMGKHIVHSDEVGNDDESCDDNIDMSEDEFSCEDSIDEMDEQEEDETPKKPETCKRVAENAFKTPACDDRQESKDCNAI